MLSIATDGAPLLTVDVVDWSRVQGQFMLMVEVRLGSRMVWREAYCRRRVKTAPHTQQREGDPPFTPNYGGSHDAPHVNEDGPGTKWLWCTVAKDDAGNKGRLVNPSELAMIQALIVGWDTTDLTHALVGEYDMRSEW